MTRAQAAEQFRKALQMFAAGLGTEEAMSVAGIYGGWKEGAVYREGDYVTFGSNSVGDPQLYRVTQPHTAQAAWTPDAVPALFSAIGLNADGIPLWSQPAGIHDAYRAGDVVEFEGALYRAAQDGTVHSPAAAPQLWESVTDTEG